MKKFLTLFLTLFVAGSVCATDVLVDGIKYNLYLDDSGNHKAGVLSNNYTGDLTIPSKVSYDNVTYSVTYIYFSGCTGLTSVTIPNSVTYIYFSGCTGLTSVTIPNSVTYIYFSGCTGLTSVTIPNSVTSIGSDAFSGCTGLSVTIPNSVTSISESAFYGCKSVTISGDISEIGRGAFNCESVTFLEGVTELPHNRDDFYGDEIYGTNLTSITIPNSVTSIGSDAFYGCTGLTSVTIPNSVTSIGESAFYGCTGLTSVTIPNSVTSIGSDAFYGCTGLTSVTIPNSVKSIDYGVFYGCTGLTSVTIPNSVKSIDDRAFYRCTSLTSVTIPNSVRSIGSEAFLETNFKSITNESSQNLNFNFTKDGFRYLASTDYDNRCFIVPLVDGEYSGDVTIPKNVEFCGRTLEVNFFEYGVGDESIFRDCIGLTSITFFSKQNPYSPHSSETFLPEKLFKDCKSLKKITIMGPPPDYSLLFDPTTDTKDIYLYVPCEFYEDYIGSDYNYSLDFEHIECIPYGDEDGKPTAIDGVSNAQTITIANNQILVNGEAPAFVTNISGQKIANQNLKAGVYFVNVEGETVKVSVK